MGATPAVGIINRRELAAADDPDTARARLAAKYAESHLHPEVAAREGYVDELIAPADTHRRVAAALRTLSSGRLPGGAA
jgi:propionyl-CoA carboxylase beta chain